MKLTFTIQLFILSFLLSSPKISAQNIPTNNSKTDSIIGEIEKIYGADQLLVNGTYFENSYKRDLGFPYFLENDFQKGYLVFKGKRYPELQLKYNIFDQTVLLNITTPNNQQLLFLPSTNFISEFSIFNKAFRKYVFEGEKEAFYQVVYDGQIKGLYHWSKQRDVSYHDARYENFVFYQDKKKTYLLINNKLEKYTSNSSLIKLFPKTYRSDIGKYMKSNKIALKTSNDESVADLFSFCDKLMNQTPFSESTNLVK